MSTLREAAQQALEALEIGYDSARAEAAQYHAAMAGYRPERHAAMDADVAKIAKAITALRAALAQEEQEPVAWQWLNTAHFRKDLPANAESGAWNPLYAHPPRHDIEKAYESTCKIINEQDKKLAELDLVAAAQREKVAHWMSSMGYATGHGDTIEDLLDHLGTQIAEGLEVEVLMEREACAKVCEGIYTNGDGAECWLQNAAEAIRARSKK